MLIELATYTNVRSAKYCRWSIRCIRLLAFCMCGSDVTRTRSLCEAECRRVADAGALVGADEEALQMWSDDVSHRNLLEAVKRELCYMPETHLPERYGPRDQTMPALPRFWLAQAGGRHPKSPPEDDVHPL